MLFPWIGLGFVAHRRVHYISVNWGNPPRLPVTSASLLGPVSLITAAVTPMSPRRASRSLAPGAQTLKSLISVLLSLQKHFHAVVSTAHKV